MRRKEDGFDKRLEGYTGEKKVGKKLMVFSAAMAGTLAFAPAVFAAYHSYPVVVSSSSRSHSSSSSRWHGSSSSSSGWHGSSSSSSGWHGSSSSSSGWHGSSSSSSGWHGSSSSSSSSTHHRPWVGSSSSSSSSSSGWHGSSSSSSSSSSFHSSSDLGVKIQVADMGGFSWDLV